KPVYNNYSGFVLIYETNDKIHSLTDIAIVNKCVTNMTRFQTLHPVLYVIGHGPYDNFYISYNVGIDDAASTDDGHIIVIRNYMNFLYALSQKGIRFNLVKRKNVKYRCIC